MAIELIKELNQNKSINDDIMNEMRNGVQNVKRRVYDALNVLAASNVLRKDGR